MVSNLLELVGFGGLVYGTFLLAGRGAAAVIGGVALIVIGVAMDRPPQPSERRRRVPSRMTTNESMARDAQAKSGQ